MVSNEEDTSVNSPIKPDETADSLTSPPAPVAPAQAAPGPINVKTAKVKKAPSNPKVFKKLDFEMISRRDDLQIKFDELTADLEKAVEELNSAIEEKWAVVETALEAMNEAVGDANQWQADVASAIQDEIDGHSEKWQEGEKGQEYEEVEQFEEEIPEVDIDKPEEIDLSIENYSELLGQRSE